MKVKMRKGTFALKFGHLASGNVITIDDKTGERWIRMGIAVLAPDKAKETEPELQPALQVQAVLHEEKPVELKALSFAELRKLAGERGFEKYGKMRKAELVELLEQEEELEEVEERNPFFDGEYEGV